MSRAHVPVTIQLLNAPSPNPEALAFFDRIIADIATGCGVPEADLPTAGQIVRRRQVFPVSATELMAINRGTLATRA